MDPAALEALRAKIKTRKLAEQGVKDPESVTSVTDVNAKGASNQKPTLADAAMAGLKAKAVAEQPEPSAADQITAGILGPLAGATPQLAQEKTPGAFQNTVDAATVAKGPVGDVVAGAGKALLAGDPKSIPNYVHEEYLNTLRAKIRIKKQGGDPNMVETAGMLAQAVAMPGGLFATPLRAATTGAVIGGGSTLFDRWRKGEDVSSNGEDYFYDTAAGAAGGFAGYHIGNYMGNFVGYLGKKFGKLDPSLAGAAEKFMEENGAIRNAAIQQMQDSKITLSRKGLQKLIYDMNKELGGIELNPATTPETFKAWTALKNRLKDKEAISLENLSAFKRVFEEAGFNEKGAIKGTLGERDFDTMQRAAKFMNDWVMKLNKMSPYIANRGGSNLTTGLAGWKNMDANNKMLFRQDRVAELIHQAELKSSDRSISFEVALQQEMKDMLKNKDFIKRVFTFEQAQQMRRIAEGDMSRKAFEALDRWMGSTLLAPVTRVSQSAFGALVEAPESRYAAKKLIEATAGKIVPKPAKVLPQGAAAPVGALGGTNLLGSE